MLSVIIPTYNRNDLLSKCLEKISPSSQNVAAFDYEVIVTDDSKDAIAKRLIAENFPWAKWIAGPKMGPAANRNHGANEAKGNWLVFIDDDCLPNDNLLHEYMNALINHKNTLVFEGCIKVDRPQSSFIEESPINENGGYLWSCNFMIERKLFIDTLQGFDEQFPYAAMEDVDLDYRLKKVQIDIIFLSKAFVIHPWRERKNIFSVTLKRFDSLLYFLEKHPERKMDLNSNYFFKSFYHGLIKNTLTNAFRFRFKGFLPKTMHDFMNLYFSVYLLIKK
jgi:GT2 family glycosyltransferase